MKKVILHQYKIAFYCHFRNGNRPVTKISKLAYKRLYLIEYEPLYRVSYVISNCLNMKKNMGKSEITDVKYDKTAISRLFMVKKTLTYINVHTSI